MSYKGEKIMKIAIGCDHGALALKEVLIPHLEKAGHEVKDFGTYTLDSCDYPDFAGAAAKAVAAGECDRGIVLCTTGIGVSIAANKVKGIRCALLSDVMSARMTREHNDTNVMAIGAAVVGQMLALEIVDTWLGTEFSHNERHQRRIDKVMALEG
jgi:ribose 5-phosphate isomerase B